MNLLDDIKFECSGCGQRLVVDSAAAGLVTDCPSCQSRLEVPRPSSRHRLPQPQREPEPEPEVDSEAHLLRQELTGANLLATERERDMVILSDKLKLARRELAEARIQRDRLSTTVTENAAAMTALEAAQADLQEKLKVELQARAELREERELSRQLATGQAAQLAAREAELAEAQALGGGLKDELHALEGRLDTVEAELAQARTELLEKPKLKKQVAKLQERQKEMEALKKTCTDLKEEREGLKRQLSESAAGREVLALRERLENLKEEAAKAGRSESLATAEAEKLRTTLAREQTDRDLLRKRCETAEKFAESHSESTSESLRGIVERQKKELLEQYNTVSQLRRAQLGVRLVYGLVTLCGMAGVAGVIFWVQHSQVLAEWFR